ncbi:RecX family transcriptional regulator [uncultured Sphingomonas sp.]|uniref:regulatory protein RecX n=1 Tax=uncultured Sphingomonas sp. TaxID=158754 RepID=UPI0025E95250|nr:RecX family transcriptional regulator [uncultured Sphingomonas sp.]
MRPFSHKNSGKPRPPLDAASLQALALHYVGRYATTRAKLRLYLQRKLGERGWEDDGAPPVEAVVSRCAQLGYVDDAGFAQARGQACLRQGYGAGRVSQVLRAAGVEAQDTEPVVTAAREEALAAALRFAQRRRIGPYAAERADRDQARRQLGAMLRAGHAMDVSRRIIAAEPGETLTES